jgi:hypothetical protein
MYCARKASTRVTPPYLLIRTRNNRAADEREEITMNGKKAFVALALTAALSILGAASAAAGSDRDRGHERGGYVLPCSLAGVNPAYHPEIFGNAGTAYAYGFIQSRDGAWQVRPDCRR